MHRLSSSLVLGYHGCDESVGEALLAGGPFKKSENDYDWLGHGIYFWEANPERGLRFAEELRRRGRPVNKPFVVGAAIELGYCLDTATESGVAAVRRAFASLRTACRANDQDLPRNSDDPDSLKRDLDCAVVQWFHSQVGRYQRPPVDTVPGVFVEGGPAYPGSGFREKTHIQICVRNPVVIKGVFRVPGMKPA